MSVKTISQGEQQIRMQFKRLTDFSFKFYLRQSGTTNPIADYATRQVFFTVRENEDAAAVYELSIGSGIEKTDAATGEFTLTISAAENVADSGKYRVELISVDANGVKKPHASGPVLISANLL